MLKNKTLALLAVSTLMFGLSACSSDADGPDSSGASSSSTGSSSASADTTDSAAVDKDAQLDTFMRSAVADGSSAAVAVDNAVGKGFDKADAQAAAERLGDDFQFAADYQAVGYLESWYFGGARSEKLDEVRSDVIAHLSELGFTDLEAESSASRITLGDYCDGVPEYCELFFDGESPDLYDMGTELDSYKPTE